VVTTSSTTEERTDAPPAVTRVTTAQRLPLATLAAGLVVLLVAAVAWRVQSGEDAVTVPYDDPASAGLLTLCAGGEPVTGGSVTDRPFADVVLGATALPAEVDPAGAVATLFAYQPREGVAPSEFSGSPLTAATPFDGTGPAATRVTDGAWSIGDFTEAFPATQDGFVQLRLYLGTPAAGTLSDRPYDTADLRVEGDTWRLVRGGDASCADAGSALVP
jgi:hypothetical protein